MIIYMVFRHEYRLLPTLAETGGTMHSSGLFGPDARGGAYDAAFPFFPDEIVKARGALTD